MADFKFFGKNVEERDEADVMRERDEVYDMLQRTHFPEGEIPQTETLRRYDPELHGMPGVFTSILRNRSDISDASFADICKEQRLQLIEQMWEDHMVTHTIVSQDENGFTLRTEINL